MNEPLIAQNLSDYASSLAAPVSSPGGGSAAALAGALGAALARMSAGLSGMEEIPELSEMQARLLALVDADAAAFAPVVEAWAIPKDDPHRPEALEEARMGAAETPLELLALCGRCTELCRALSGAVNAQVISDVAAALALCLCAMRMAAVNVCANSFYMKDRSRAETLNARAEALLAQYEPLAQESLTRIYEELGRGK